MQWEKEASAKFDNFLLQADLYELVHQKILRPGEPYQEIQKAATEVHADLIVMGSSGRSGLLEEAVARFKHLLRHDMHFAPGWDVIAHAYERLNQPEEAEVCRERAKKIRERLWAQRVDADIRRRHFV